MGKLPTAEQKCDSCDHIQQVTIKRIKERARLGLTFRCHKCTCRSPEHIAKMKAVAARPGRREHLSAASRAAWSDPARIQAAANTADALWADPAFVARAHAASHHPEYLARKSHAAKVRWDDPKYRDTVMRRQREANEAACQGVRDAWKRPEYAARQRELSIALWQNPEYRQRAVARAKAQWLDPAFRSRQMNMKGSDWYRTKLADAQSRQPRISSLQVTLYTMLGDLGVPYHPEGLSTVCGPWTFDCMVPGTNGRKNLLIECQGEYWHDRPVTQARDAAKFAYVERYFPDHEIMYLWEHEFSAKDRVLDRLKLKLGLTVETVDFSLREIRMATPTTAEARLFLDAYHYIGKGRGGVIHGAYHNNKLVAVCVFSPPLRQNMQLHGNFVELSRLCIHPSYHKKNFASWFISRCVSAESHPIVAYADTTVGHAGTVYKAANFRLSHEVEPDYWYISADGWVMHKRTLYGRACKMSMTEADYAAKHGYQKKWGGRKLCFTFHR